MPTPSSSLATLRPELAGSVEEFNLEASRRMFIGNQVLPIQNVTKASGTFGRIPIEQLLQSPSITRNPGGTYASGSYTFTTDSFTTIEYGFEDPVDDKEAVLYRDYFDAEMVSAARAYDMVLRAYERRVAAAVFNATTWTGSDLATSVSTEWSTTASSTPISDVEAAVRKVRTNSGLVANTLIVGFTAFRNLRLNTSIVERIASVGAGSPTKASDITPAMLAAVFDLDQVLVGYGQYNSAALGQTAVLADIWDDEYAMVCHINASSPDIRIPTLGRTFHWAEDGSMPNGTFETYRKEEIRSDVVRVRHQTAEKIIYVEAGHLLANITA